MWWRAISALVTLKVVRKWRRPFFSIKNLKSCKAVMEFFLSFRSFKSCGHASLSFQMMFKFSGTVFPLSVPTEFFDYISLTIHFNLPEERCRAHFHKYCNSYFPTTQINSFTYIMSKAVFPSFPSCSCLDYFRKCRLKSPYVSNDCLWKLYL